MIQDYTLEQTLLTLMFLIGMILGSAITVAIMTYQRNKSDEIRRTLED